MTEINAQEFLDKNVDKTQEKVISHGSLWLKESEKLTGDLTIQDYPNLEEIYLPSHELTSLKVVNCPKLKQINVRNNQLAKLEISENNQIKEIIAGQNELTALNLTNCQNQ